jgi:hypothetical protein
VECQSTTLWRFDQISFEDVAAMTTLRMRFTRLPDPVDLGCRDPDFAAFRASDERDTHAVERASEREN